MASKIIQYNRGNPMSASIYNGQIADRFDPIFTEGNVAFSSDVNNKLTIPELMMQILENGKRKVIGKNLFFSYDGCWLTIDATGKIEIGEGAA